MSDETPAPREARLPSGDHDGSWYDDKPITQEQFRALSDSVESGELPSYSRFVVRKLLTEIERLGGELETLLEEKAAAFVDATTMFRGLTIRDGQAHLEIEPAREMILIWCASVRAMLDEHQAQNYTELELEMPANSVSLDIQDGQNPTDSYTLTLQRRYGKTPHQLREQAERERDEARARLAEIGTTREEFALRTGDGREAFCATAEGAARIAEDWNRIRSDGPWSAERRHVGQWHKVKPACPWCSRTSPSSSDCICPSHCGTHACASGGREAGRG